MSGNSVKCACIHQGIFAHFCFARIDIDTWALGTWLDAKVIFFHVIWFLHHWAMSFGHFTDQSAWTKQELICTVHLLLDVVLKYCIKIVHIIYLGQSKADARPGWMHRIVTRTAQQRRRVNFSSGAQQQLAKREPSSIAWFSYQRQAPARYLQPKRLQRERERGRSCGEKAKAIRLGVK